MPAARPKLIDVHLRLFEEDVAELKRRAAADGDVEWQPRLRKLVHDALRAKKVLR